MAPHFQDTVEQPLILELLARRMWFKPDQFEQIEDLVRKAGPAVLPEVTLIRAGHISEIEVVRIYGEDLFLPVVSSEIEAGEIDPDVGPLLPEKLCLERLICPLVVHEDVLDVLFVSPEAMGVIDELHLMTGLRINPKIAPLSVVQSRLEEFYRAEEGQ